MIWFLAILLGIWFCIWLVNAIKEYTENKKYVVKLREINKRISNTEINQINKEVEHLLNMSNNVFERMKIFGIDSDQNRKPSVAHFVEADTEESRKKRRLKSRSNTTQRKRR
jgi:TATA-binding protein-associated factor Taf7